VEIDRVLEFFKLLSDESRLRLVGLLANRDATVDELAAALDLRPPTVSHHLGRLRDHGLVRATAEGTSRRYSLDREALRALARDCLSPATVRAFDPAPAADAWERKVHRSFFRDGRLVEIPASRKKRLVILRALADRFEPGRRYPEREVDTLLAAFHPDVATLRRELVAEGHGLLTRKDGVYWRVDVAGA
jgi:hypothetical protein